jgi:hypothetical protein
MIERKVMRKPVHKIIAALLTGILMLFLTACGGGIDVVDAGTYTGTVDKAVAGEQEIYLSLDNGMRLELYFTDATQLTEGARPVDFSQLEKGDRVQVTVDREGNRNIPMQVVIIE